MTGAASGRTLLTSIQRRLPVKLYDNPTSKSARRVRIFLAEKGIEIPRENVDLNRGEQRSPAFLAKNPLGQVPVLELEDGTYLAESVAICRYFEELQPAPPLFGSTAREKAEVEMWSRRVEFGLAGPVVTAWMHGSPMWAGRFAQIPALAETGRGEVCSFFRLLDGVLADHEFIAGADFSMADILALCSVDFAAGAVGLTADAGQHNLARWHKAVSGRPSARA
jgi:glutathione S-transferase